jgi:hypothetical protein
VCLAAFGSEFHKLTEAERHAGLRLGPAEHQQRPPG